MQHPSLVIDEEDRADFAVAGDVASKLVHTVVDSLRTEPTMTRIGIVRRLQEHSEELARLVRRLQEREKENEDVDLHETD